MNLNENTPPVKGIRNFSNRNVSYAHAVLQAIARLDCAKEFLEKSNKEVVQREEQFALTRELYNLFDCIINNYKDGYSDRLLEKFEKGNLKNSELKKKASIEEPYYFLSFLLYFLHEENKCIQNFNCNYLNKKTKEEHYNDDDMYISFLDYLNKTQKSMIYDYFHGTEKYTFRCNNCGDYYDYGSKNIIKINVDKVKSLRDSAYPNLSGTNLTLDDCLEYYSGGHQVICNYCGNSISKYTEFCHPPKVLIFSFSRKNNNNFADIDFNDELDISNYFCKKSSNLNIIPYYSLKACIFRQNESYIADCYVKYMDTGSWFRFYDENIQHLGSNYEHKNAPILLIYELDKSFKEKQSINNNNIINNINNNQNNNNTMNNQYYNNNINQFNNYYNNNINNNNSNYNQDTPNINNNNQMNNYIQFNNQMNSNNQYIPNIDNNNQYMPNMDSNNQYNNQMDNNIQYNNQYNNQMDNNIQFNNQYNNQMDNNNQMNNNNQYNNQMNNNNQFNNQMNNNYGMSNNYGMNNNNSYNMNNTNMNNNNMNNNNINNFN